MEKISNTDNLGRLYGGESSEDRILRRKQQILDAGLQLFGTVGYKAASVRALCREAKLTARYFYESFASVEEVLIEVYRRESVTLAERLTLAVGEVRPGEPVGDIARQGLQAFFDSARNPVVSRTIWLEVLGVSPTVNALYQHTLREFSELFLLLVRSMYPDWKHTPEMEKALAMAVVGAVSTSTMNWMLEDYKTPVDVLVEANALLIEGLAVVTQKNQE